MTRYRSSRAVWCLLAVVVLGCSCGRVHEPDGAPNRSAPERIVSLTLATDELLVDLVPSEHVIGITALSDDPEVSNVAGRYPEQTARLREATPEKIIALSPDLVCVAPYNSADTIELLSRSGLAIYRNESVRSIDEIEAGIGRLGARIGQPERARAMVERMHNRRKQLAERLQGQPGRPRVLFWSAGFTSGRATTIDDIIREGGGTNVAIELGLEGSAEIVPERVIAADPEFVLLSHWKGDERHSQITSHPILRQLRAVREGHVIEIDSRYLTSVSQFVVEGAERLAAALHPDVFATEARP